jgi:hypothetical protein
MNDNDPGLEDVLEAALGGVIAGLRVALPGRIESYDSATRRASVQILVQDGDIDETGERITTTIKPLNDVPVMRVGSGIERFKFPIRTGDLCMPVFASSSIAEFKARGALVDPGDDRHHHEADAIAIAGLFVDGDDAPGTFIEITDQEILNLGGTPAVQSALLGEALLTQLSTLVTSIASAVGGIPTGGAAAAAAITAALGVFTGAAATYTSQKVKLV